MAQGQEPESRDNREQGPTGAMGGSELPSPTGLGVSEPANRAETQTRKNKKRERERLVISEPVRGLLVAVAKTSRVPQGHYTHPFSRRPFLASSTIKATPAATRCSHASQFQRFLSTPLLLLLGCAALHAQQQQPASAPLPRGAAPGHGYVSRRLFFGGLSSCLLVLALRSVRPGHRFR